VTDGYVPGGALSGDAHAPRIRGSVAVKAGIHISYIIVL
jgi:hypothetical protein